MNKNPGVLYMERLTISPSNSKKIAAFITSELTNLKAVENIVEKVKKEGDPKRKEFENQIVEDYFYQGLFPMIYMFAKNIQTTFYINNKKNNRGTLPDYRSSVKKVFKKFNEVSNRLNTILGKKISSKIDKDLITVRELGHQKLSLCRH
jgi:hypothetical protein